MQASKDGETTKGVTFITNCHPNENVGRHAGENLVIEEFRARGYSVEQAQMKDTCEVDGEETPWWVIYTIPGRENERVEEEVRLAREAKSPPVTWHDDPFDSESWKGLSPKATVTREDKDVGFPFITVEVRAPLHLVSNTERIRAGLEVAERLGKKAGYIAMESRIEDVELTPHCVKELADSIERAINSNETDYAEFIR